MKFVPKAVLTITFVAAASLAAAFVGGISLAAPNNPPPPSPDPVPPGLPIDSGILMLIVAAAGLGIYKIYQSKYRKAPR
ncbi:MAG: hypothetical protein EOO50_08190 [Flavobacterium sp.]|nr:MAG: hypothetical protein EOO50_08190 [Flavobacterium sp.]